jgi:GNAT superfamily N-acetyltransferase
VGYGTALLEKAEQWAKQKGCKTVTVFTLKDWPACGWYQNHGFVIEYERAGHGNNSVGCYLIKRL